MSTWDIDLKEGETMLDVGCGIRPHPKANVGIDLYNFDNTTNKKIKFVKHDFTKLPLPFPDNSFDVCYSRCLFEHLSNPVEMANEMYRICKRKLIIVVPHYSSQVAFAHIEHRNFFTSNTFSTFYTKEDMNWGMIKWKGKAKSTLIYAENKHRLKFLNPFYNLFVNINPVATERYLLPLVYGGFDFVRFEFEKEQEK